MPAPDLMQVRHADLQCRFVASDEGIVEGYASRFGEEDSYGDILQPGAFSASLAEHRARGTAPALLWQHREPAGVWEAIEERADGLFVRGKFALSTTTGREAFEHVKAGTTTGLSIGFRYVDFDQKPDGTWIVKSVDLHEISLTPTPSAPRARVTNVRQIEGFPMPDPIVPAQPVPAPVPPVPAPVPTQPAPDFEARFAEMQRRLDEAEARSQRPGSTTTDEVSEQRAAWRSYLSRGESSETRALTVGSDTGAGYLAPPEASTEFLRNLVQFSPIRALASVRSTTATAVIYPRRDTIPEAWWVGETQDRQETDMAFGQVTIPMHEMATAVPISNWLLEDSATAEAEVNLGLSERAGAMENHAFLLGDGVAKPLGILVAEGIAEVPSGDATKLTADGLIDIFHALPEPYRSRATWLMNSTTTAAVRKLKSGDGQYLWANGLGTTPNTILGRPVVEATTEDMPNVEAGATPVLFGDFATGYRIIDRVGMQVLRDPYSRAGNGQILFRSRRRLGAGVVAPGAFRKLKIAAA